MTPQDLQALAPIIAISVGVIVAFLCFRSGSRAAKERQKLEEKKKQEGNGSTNS
jgi:uncharacterized membrane-anchored protein YhcB (DUF1043 family)